ncbi:MAG: PEP-CTERM sorting domain-containing protein [Acidobacteria bacterium]|nr:PEP-CTERM sorting domain-containing protein [Acidobacteriota bacterium]
MKATYVVLAAICIFACPVFADTFHGVEFPQGIVSFADVIVSYDPVIKSGQPTAPYRIASEAIGAPDYPEGPTEGYVSLGDGGSITVQFTDNSLTGSGNSDKDLWIFEIGPDVEDTFVEISKNGATWYSVGAVTGATKGVDIDAFGWTQLDFFSFVRLTDDPNLDDQSGNTVGADIDAIGAITSAPPVDIVPEPTSLLLLGTGLGLAGIAAWRRKK